MKNKLILLFAMLIVFSCTTDTDFQEELDLNQIEENNPENLISLQTSLDSNSNQTTNDANATKNSNVKSSGFHENKSFDNTFIDESGPVICSDYVSQHLFDANHNYGSSVKIVNVYYDPGLVSLDDINCIRKEMTESFNVFSTFVAFDIVSLNDNNPYHDVWKVILINYPFPMSPDGPSEQPVKDTIRNDPRTN